MKKKIVLLLCILMSALCLAGCKNKASDVSYDTESMQEIAEVVISNFVSMTDEDFQIYKNLTEYQMDYVMMNAGLRIEATDFVSMINSWEAGESECGAYVSHGEFRVKESGEGVTITTSAEYEKRKADITFVFSQDSYLESMDISAKYSMKEMFTKAGQNTLIGMGIVFAVLLFLAFLIYLMKYIPQLIEKVQTAEEVATRKEEVATPYQAQTVDVSDDLELIAVITAAIAIQTGTSTDGFVVRSIRRRPSNKWK